MESKGMAANRKKRCGNESGDYHVEGNKAWKA